MFLLVVGGIFLCALGFVVVKLYYRPRNANNPVFVGPDIWTNISLLTDPNSCSGATHFHDLSMALTGFGKTTYGAVYQLYMTSANFVVITDYKLARLVLVGDNSQGIRESEKTSVSRAFDLFLNHGSIFSSPTADPARRAARKFIAPCFSYTHLKYTFGVILKSLVACQNKLAAYAASGAEFELNDVMIRLTFDVITESSFDVNWNTQNEELESDGSVYLRESDKLLREGFRRAFNPLRKYCFWTEDHKRNELARDRIASLLRRVVSKYRAGHEEEEGEEDTSIMGHLMRHQYEHEDRRISDMNTFLTAGE